MSCWTEQSRQFVHQLSKMTSIIAFFCSLGTPKSHWILLQFRHAIVSLGSSAVWVRQSLVGFLSSLGTPHVYWVLLKFRHAKVSMGSSAV